MDVDIESPYLKERHTHMTLNGPILEGYACKVKVYVGPGIVMGCDVIIVASSADIAEGIAATLSYQRPSQAFHCLVGQPPWYQNKTQGNTLQGVQLHVDHSGEDESDRWKLVATHRPTT